MINPTETLQETDSTGQSNVCELSLESVAPETKDLDVIGEANSSVPLITVCSKSKHVETEQELAQRASSISDSRLSIAPIPHTLSPSLGDHTETQKVKTCSEYSLKPTPVSVTEVDAISIDNLSDKDLAQALDDPFREDFCIPGCSPKTFVFSNSSGAIPPVFHDRYREVINIFRYNTEQDPQLRDNIQHIDYSLRLCGASRGATHPSILVFCRPKEFKALKGLLTRKELKYQYCLREPSTRYPWGAKRVDHMKNDKPLFNIYFWREHRPRTLFWGQSHAKIHPPPTASSHWLQQPVLVGAELTLCGSSVETLGSKPQFSTVGCIVKIDSEFYAVTCGHTFLESSREVHNLDVSDYHSGSSSIDVTAGHATKATVHNELPQYNSGFDSLDQSLEEESYFIDGVDYESMSEGDEHIQNEPARVGTSPVEVKIPSEGKESLALFPTPLELENSGGLDLDWAIIKLEDPKLWRPNVFVSPETSQLAFISGIADCQPLRSTPVVVVVGGTIARRGTLQPGISMLGGINGKSPSLMQTVTLCDHDGEVKTGLKTGDSGSIVVDAKTNAIYGHVVGANPIGEIYISSYSAIFDQIQKMFHGSAVVLPDCLQTLSDLIQFHDTSVQDESQLGVLSRLKDAYTKAQTVLIGTKTQNGWSDNVGSSNVLVASGGVQRSIASTTTGHNINSPDLTLRQIVPLDVPDRIKQPALLKASVVNKRWKLNENIPKIPSKRRRIETFDEPLNLSEFCQTCEVLRSSLHQTDQHRSGPQDLGILSDLLVHCPGHHDLVHEFLSFCRTPSRSQDCLPAPLNQLTRYEPDHLYLQAEDGRFRLSTTHFFWTLCMAKREDVLHHKGLGRILDPNWADISGARRCKDRCISSHGQECIDPLRVGNASPEWLIDTQTDTLVPGNSASAFVAISYRWGDGKYLGTTVDNLRQHQEHGSLRRPGVSSKLAPIVRRAMHLVQAMGERYLWTDTLCIVDGDEHLKARELKRMGEIYASAVFTIVVADGDAETGLHGIQGISPSRELKQHLIPFNDEQLIVTDAHLGMNTEYDNRGWTFQEFMLSKRRLIFRKSKLFWMCHREQAAEEFFWGEDLGGSLHSEEEPMDTILAGFPGLDYLNSVIVRYNRRNFTYEDDALPGIRGLLTLLSRTFHQGFLYGLPEMAFDQALAWRLVSGEMEEREASDKDGYADNPDYALPSWSWIGWQGNVQIPSQLGLEAGRQDGQLDTIIPTAEWFTSELPKSGSGRRIQSMFTNILKRHKSRTETLLPGWTRRKYESRDRKLLPVPPKGGGQYIFTHESLPERYFWQQFPLKRIESSTTSFNPEQTPYISCKTNRSWLTARRGHSQLGSPPQCVTLSDQNGVDCGLLQVHSTDRFEEMFTDTTEVIVELVAICKRRVVDLKIGSGEALGEEPGEDIDEELGTGLDGASIERTEYVVLWIEWVDQVAYRKGIGWIPEASWESLYLEEVDLVLG